MCRGGFLDAIATFHGITGSSRNNVIRMDFHSTVYGSRVGSGGKIIPSIVHPFAVIYPFTMSAGTVHRTVRITAFRFPFPVGFPFPVVMPFGTPHAPACSSFLRIGGQGRNGKARINIGCHRIRRNVFVQRYDFGSKAGLCSGCTADGYIDG